MPELRAATRTRCASATAPGDTPRRTTAAHHAGLTLVELLVVLVILATLATAAAVSTTGIVDQTRYEATRDILQRARQAVLGDPELVDGQHRPWVRGFVADMGRLPVAVDGPAGPAAELWIPPVGPLDPIELVDALRYGVKHALGDDDVLLPAGWRGPYLSLPLGTATLLDGWARPPLALGTDSQPVLLGASLGGLRSLGADGEFTPEPNASYDQDIDVVFRSLPAQTPDVGEVPFAVTGAVPTDDPELIGSELFLLVRLYGPHVEFPSDLLEPHPGQIVTIAEPFPVALGIVSEADAVVDDGDPPLTPGDALEASSVFTDVPIGPRALRAYLIADLDPGTLDANDLLDVHDVDDGIDIVAWSPVVYVPVVPGGVPTVTLELR